VHLAKKGNNIASPAFLIVLFNEGVGRSGLELADERGFNVPVTE
jgi:hypothetical protein